MSLQQLAAKTKVIAAGVTTDGKIRATVMLTPHCAEDQEALLSDWPSQMIAWLEQHEPGSPPDRKWQVRLGVEPVTYVDNGTKCPPPRSPQPIGATALGMKLAWQTRTERTWLGELWREAFTVDGKQDWKALAKLIRASTEGKSLVSGGMQQPPVNQAAAHIERSTNAGSSTVSIESILPNRQSDLAFVLECKRALEFCDTLRHADDSVRYAGNDKQSLVEAKCAVAAQNPALVRSKPDATGVSQGLKEGDALLLLDDLFIRSRDHYKKVEGTVESAYKEIVCNDKPVGPLPAPMVDRGGLATNRLGCEINLHPALNAFEAANLAQYDKKDELPKSKEELASDADRDRLATLSQRYYYIQGSPALSRLFGLTFDVYMSAQQFDDLWEKNAEGEPVNGTRASVGGGRFAYISIDGSSLCANSSACTIYTLAKFRPDKDGKKHHFWPASRGELQLGRNAPLSAYRTLSQYDGMVITSQQVESSKKPGENGPALFAPRFDLSSLDIRVATEAALDRRLSEASEDSIAQQYKDASLAARPMSVSRKTHLTGGITILDRGRQDQAIAQLAARAVHQKKLNDQPLVLLDADDLTIGYRIDIGVASKGDSKEQWRSLMSRRMHHGATGQYGSLVKAVVPALYEDSNKGGDGAWRTCLEDGILALAARLVPRDNRTVETPNLGTSAPADVPENVPRQVDAYVEESIAVWQGDPMGASSAGSRQDKVQEVEGMVVGNIIKLPTQTLEKERRPFALRFGWPYGFAMRAVYAGGISIPLDHAKAKYQDEDGNCIRVDGADLTIPSAYNVAKAWGSEEPRPRDRMRRHLRHERIDAPFLLLPASIAVSRHGDMGYERAAHAVVRSVKDPHNRNRDQPAATQRIFVVPTVSSSLAAMHGVFNDVREGKPRQGLTSASLGPNGVRYDATTGGFPIATADSIVGKDGVRYDKARFITNDTEKYSGDLVYALAGNTHQRKEEHPYHPDPGVDFYVIGVRYPGTDEYLEGPPCVIPIYKRGRRYPDASPLVLTITRTGRRASSSPTLQDVLSWPGGPSAVLNVLSRLPGTIDVVLKLAPGEDFEVDVWCIPSAERLACHFALIDDIGTLAVLASEPVTESPKKVATSGCGIARQPTRGEFSAGVKKLLPESVWQSIDAALPAGADDASIADWMEGYAGLGGMPGPGPKSLMAIARGIHELLGKRPLDELSGVRTLRATHAIDQPHVAPAARSSLTPGDTKIAGLEQIELERTPVLVDGKVRHEVHATGQVALHLPTTGSLEIRARMVSPMSQVIDDVRRGRALKDRRDSQWPQGADGNPLSAEDVYGFGLTADGEPILQLAEETLQQLEKLPPSPRTAGYDMKPDGTCVLSLDTFFGRAAPATKIGNSKLPFQFKDQLARKLCLEFRAYPPNAEQMRTASPPARDGRWLRDGKQLDPEFSKCSSEIVEAWLPAGVRPAEPAALSPIPAFIWRDRPASGRLGKRAVRKERRSVIRIPLQRPWFSSGEGERLGIVIWPPNFSRQNAIWFANDIVTLAPKEEWDAERTVDLSKFSDEDLGAGGKFVTRWGGDPIRPAATLAGEFVYDDSDAVGDWTTKPQAYKRTFVPKSAFLDWNPKTRLGFVATLVEGVQMPIKLLGKNPADDKTPAEAPPLKVALLTYVPRFDIENDQWYVDVGIDHPSEAEPFVRLGLVRYQEHAPPELQVSYPVIQWAQLLPRRDVEVGTVSSPDKKKFSVRIEGLSLMPSGLPQVDSTGERTADYRVITKVVRQHELDSGAIERRTVTPKTIDDCSSNSGSVNGAFGCVWQEEIEIETDDRKDIAEKAQYSLFISEREARLPATYTDEPVSAKQAAGLNCEGTPDDSLLIEAGPRFLAHIAIAADSGQKEELCGPT